ncbi:FAD-dependent oxidoreductase [Agrococcus sp. ARC_14]|uniref:FAD-dependent oxidoreductase n=1 Tax=Agrococcus sp. ARC_14 TaxID=2919927 RepID=UPI001F0532D2|nr:FAD-dependent oxidoreductase [Agrococcus sp. ARC_14]MCH1883828.1 FAD-dependent oxidoreductase [Agrococcus sp. ARC_14]
MTAGTTPRLAIWQLDAVSDGSDLPVLAEVDVCIVGAGAAGVAAAVTCAEAGLSSVVIEKYGFAGGAAVAGMSGTICGLFQASDRSSTPVQVVRGFTERFMVGLEQRHGLTAPQPYGKTWTVAHDPLVWRETADDMLTRAGVRVLFHTAVTGVVLDGDRHRGVVIESNAGRAVVLARRTIDASGDGAVAVRAGLDYTFGDEGAIQNPTMFFRLGGVDAAAFWQEWGADTICSEATTHRIAAASDAGLDLPRKKIWAFATPQPGQLLVNATRLSGADGRMLNVIDPEDFTEAEILGRRQVREYERFFRDAFDSCRGAYVIDTGVEAGIRQTRTITGVETLTNDDVIGLRKRPDGIARSPWPIELHVGERPKLHWLLDDFYEVPYLALVPERGEDIIVAGRCLSAEHEALASCRVTAQCFEYGQAAAVATVLSLQSSSAYRELAGERIRSEMIGLGSEL